MSKEVSGKLMALRVRRNGETDFKRSVCETSGTLDLSRDVSTTQTNCGAKTSVAELTYTLSQDAVANVEPGATEASLAYWIDIMKTGDLIDWQRANISGSGVDADEIYNWGSGYVTSVSVNSATEDNVSFTIEITGTGDLDSFAGDDSDS